MISLSLSKYIKCDLHEQLNKNIDQHNEYVQLDPFLYRIHEYLRLVHKWEND